jgi:hypothetical protein
VGTFWGATPLTDTKLRKEIDSHAFDEFVISHFEKGLIGARAGIVRAGRDFA